MALTSNDIHILDPTQDDAYIIVAIDHLKLAVLILLFIFILFCRRFL
jgi:hypothetical protein